MIKYEINLLNKILKYLEEEHFNFFTIRTFYFNNNCFSFYEKEIGEKGLYVLIKGALNDINFKVVLSDIIKSRFPSEKCNACHVYPAAIGRKCKSCSGLLNHSFSEYKTPARRSGQTTRIIDAAIKELFTKGELYLLKKTAFYKNRSVTPAGKTQFVDPDHKMSNQAQYDFIYRVMKRLEAEHKGFHKIKTINKDYIHVIVK